MCPKLWEIYIYPYKYVYKQILDFLLSQCPNYYVSHPAETLAKPLSALAS